MAKDSEDKNKDEEIKWDSVNEDKHGVSDYLRKLATAGLSAAFMTEESIRSFVSELKLPKESLNIILQGAAKSKEELTSRVGNELVKMISKIDFVSEASKFVEEHKFKVSAEIEVIRKDTNSSVSKISKDGDSSEFETEIKID